MSVFVTSFFVRFANPAWGRVLYKLCLSNWIIEAISLAYSKGQGLPSGVPAHSTRGVVASWALFRDLTIVDICAAASWGSKHTFMRLYCFITWLIVFFWLGPEVGVRQCAGCSFIRVTTIPCGFEPWAAMAAHEYTVSRFLCV